MCFNDWVSVLWVLVISTKPAAFKSQRPLGFLCRMSCKNVQSFAVLHYVCTTSFVSKLGICREEFVCLKDTYLRLPYPFIFAYCWSCCFFCCFCSSEDLSSVTFHLWKRRDLVMKCRHWEREMTERREVSHSVLWVFVLQHIVKFPSLFVFAFFDFSSFENSDFPSGSWPSSCLHCVFSPVFFAATMHFCLLFAAIHFPHYSHLITHLFPTFLSFFFWCTVLLPPAHSSFLFSAFPLFPLIHLFIPFSPCSTFCYNFLFIYYASILSPVSPPPSCMIWAPLLNHSPALQAAWPQIAAVSTWVIRPAAAGVAATVSGAPSAASVCPDTQDTSVKRVRHAFIWLVH